MRSKLLSDRKCALIVLLLMVPVFVIAQTTGKISGRVVDKSSHEPLPGANVSVEGTSIGTSTDTEGSFVIINMPPGNFRLKVSFIGYAPLVVADVRVLVNQTTTVTAELVQSTIEVREMLVVADRPMVRKDATGTVSVVTKEELQSLAGVRNFVDVLSMRSGVVAEGSNLYVRGGRANEVAYLIDGVYIQDPLFGGLGTQIHNDAIEQLEFLTGTYSAEFGDAMSGVVNIVTREGGEKLQAKVDLRTSEFAKPYSAYREGRLIGTISGTLPGLSTMTFLLTGEQDYRGSWLPFGYQRDLSTMGKITQRFSSEFRATASYRYTKEGRQGYSHAWKYIPEQYLQSRRSSNQISVNAKHVLSERSFYDVKASLFEQKYQLGILDSKGNFLDTSQYLNTAQRVYKTDAGNGFEFYQLALPVNYNDSRTQTLDLKGDLVWAPTKEHEIKAGLEFKRHELRLFNVYDPKRNFPYINNYSRNPVEGSAYLQDKMEFPSLIINLGLRFDYADQRTTFRNDPLNPTLIVTPKAKTQISPRIGIGHPISDRTNLHFSYGHFFQRPEYQFLFENGQYDLNVREPLFGQPDLDAERTVAYEVGISHQFTDQLAATLTAYYKDVTGLIGTRYYNPFYQGRYVGYTLYVNEDYANMKGFTVDVTLRRTQNLAAGFTYTYSVAKGSASSETEQYPGTQESTLLYYLGQDKTHSLSGNVSLVFRDQQGPSLFGFRLLQRTYWNVIARSSSGFPYTPGGRDVGFVVRNSARMPWTFALDLEAGREWDFYGIRWTIFAEALNLTNYRNILYVYTDTGLPDATLQGRNSQEWIRNPSNFGPPRRVRLGLRMQIL
jgi:outer membrane receptor protein involved in Fe transport